MSLSRFIHLRSNIIPALLFLILVPLATSLGAAIKWDPVDKAELSDTTPQVDAEAGAEILLKETIIDHSDFDKVSSRHYVRAKIYSQRGIDDFAKIDIPFGKDERVRDIYARTIKPDGAILELAGKDVFEREIIKVGKERVKAKSFAPPGLEAGVIIEYRYTEVSDVSTIFVPLIFQGEIPARLVRYKYKPIEMERPGVNMRTLFFNCGQMPMKRGKDGYYLFEVKNVPAAKEEPFQPPAINTNTSLLIYYTLDRNIPAALYWKNEGRDLYTRMEEVTKPSKAITTTLSQITSPGDSDLEKLKKIHDYCRTKIVNWDSSTSGLDAKQIAKLKSNETAADTLKQGKGSRYDINVLFIALARAAKLDARLASVNRRDWLMFNAKITESFIMTPDTVVAVHIGDDWKYCDPGSMYHAFGSLNWRNSDTAIVIADKENAKPTVAKGDSADKNIRTRKATFNVDSEGTLEGDVTLDYTGQWEAEVKDALDSLTAKETESYFQDEIKEYLKLAEISQVKVENANSALLPLKASYHLRVPEYADRTGSRLFFQPAVFHKNIPAWFTSDKRNNDLTFDYRYISKDEIRFTTPPDYELEAASSPGKFEMGDLGLYTASVSLSKRSREIIYERKFAMAAYYIGKDYYKAVKGAFESIQKRDAHTLTLKRSEAKETALPQVEPSSESKPAGEAPAANAATSGAN